MGSSEALGVVVVNYGSSELLRVNLAPLTRDGRVIVVVDNPTTGAEREAVTRLAQEHGWSLVTPERNLGFGGGVNAGADAALAAGADMLLVLNPDATIDEDSIAALVDDVRRDPKALSAPVTTAGDGTVFFDGAGLDVSTGRMVTREHLGEPGIEPWISGACFCVSAALWRRVGGFDDDFFLYWEDVDLSRRVREAGGTLIVNTAARARHDEGGTHSHERSAQHRAKSDLYYYYNVRNRMLYARRHLTPAAQRRWLLSSPAAAREILLRGGRRQFLHSRSGLVAAARGVKDGARDATGARRSSSAPSASGVRVLMTYMTPLPFHNPYVKMLDEALVGTGEAEVMHFSWRAALLGRYDVLHAHWPEDTMIATTPLKSVVKRLCFGLLIARARALRTPIVRTVHNLDLPQGLPFGEVPLLRAFERATTGHVLISDTTRAPQGPSKVILHGDYAAWYAHHPHEDKVAGRIAYFGMVRRYKNVEALAAAFAATRSTHPDWSLVIAGRPSSEELAASVEAELDGDPRARTMLRYLEDAEIVAVATSADLVVLPYREMHNSGSLLAALSLARPVLVPDNEANRAIAREVGPGWVFTYTGELSVADLERTMEQVAGRTAEARPDLSARDWGLGGRRHVEFYRELLGRR